MPAGARAGAAGSPRTAARYKQTRWGWWPFWWARWWWGAGPGGGWLFLCQALIIMHARTCMQISLYIGACTHCVVALGGECASVAPCRTRAPAQTRHRPARGAGLLRGAAGGPRRTSSTREARALRPQPDQTQAGWVAKEVASARQAVARMRGGAYVHRCLVVFASGHRVFLDVFPHSWRGRGATGNNDALCCESPSSLCGVGFRVPGKASCAQCPLCFTRLAYATHHTAVADPPCPPPLPGPGPGPCPGLPGGVRGAAASA